VELLRLSGWPAEVLEARDKRPRLAADAAAFWRELLLGEHMQDVVLLRDGLRQLGLEEEACLPVELRQALDNSESVVGFLTNLARTSATPTATTTATTTAPSSDWLDALQANVECVDPESHLQQDALELAEDLGLLDMDEAQNAARVWWRQPVQCNESAVGAIRQEETSTPPAVQAAVLTRAGLRRKAFAVSALMSVQHPSASSLYICEMRRREPRVSPGGFTTSCSLRHCSDALGARLARWTAAWGRDDDGLFVGGPGGGKGLHVDQRPESNVGKNWRGHKLFALWPPGPEGEKALESCYGQVFSAPLTPLQVDALKRAKTVMLLRPGDVFLFNGALPHTALCISKDLGVTGYEGLLTLSPPHISQFIQVASSFAGSWRRVGEDWKEELVRNVQELRLLSAQESRASPTPDVETRQDLEDLQKHELPKLLEQAIAVLRKDRFCNELAWPGDAEAPGEQPLSLSRAEVAWFCLRRFLNKCCCC
ncbi:unnamed protein product, partial [Polarella glacialis]